MRIVFAGTPHVAVPSLRELAQRDIEISAVITRPDAFLGRKRIRTPSPVSVAATDLGLPTIAAATLDEGNVADQIRSLTPDLGVIVAYGGIVREPLLSFPAQGWINVHFSLLPRWRGAAPVQRALIAGDTKTGATVFQIDSRIDQGAIFAEHEMVIDEHITAGELLVKLARASAPTLASVVDSISAGTAVSYPQLGEPSWAPKLTIDEAHLDWNESAHAVYNRYRGTTPEPGAFCTAAGKRLIILEAEIARSIDRMPPGHVAHVERRVYVGTATDPIHLAVVHPEGRRAMPAIDWWRGQKTSSLLLG